LEGVTQAINKVYFGYVVNTLPTYLMVETGYRQISSDMLQLIIQFCPLSVHHGFCGIKLPPYILPLLSPFLQSSLNALVNGISNSFLGSLIKKASLGRVHSSHEAYDSPQFSLESYFLIFSDI
jgi:hypothetical protein